MRRDFSPRLDQERTGFDGVNVGVVPFIDGARVLTFSILDEEPALASFSSFFFFSPFLNMFQAAPLQKN